MGLFSVGTWGRSKRRKTFLHPLPLGKAARKTAVPPVALFDDHVNVRVEGEATPVKSERRCRATLLVRGVERPKEDRSCPLFCLGAVAGAQTPFFLPSSSV